MKELKAYITTRGGSLLGLVEKSALISRCKEVQAGNMSAMGGAEAGCASSTPRKKQKAAPHLQQKAPHLQVASEKTATGAAAAAATEKKRQSRKGGGGRQKATGAAEGVEHATDAGGCEKMIAGGVSRFFLSFFLVFLFLSLSLSLSLSLPHLTPFVLRSV